MRAESRRDEDMGAAGGGGGIDGDGDGGGGGGSDGDCGDGCGCGGGSAGDCGDGGGGCDGGVVIVVLVFVMMVVMFLLGLIISLSVCYNIRKKCACVNFYSFLFVLVGFVTDKRSKDYETHPSDSKFGSMYYIIFMVRIWVNIYVTLQKQTK